MLKAMCIIRHCIECLGIVYIAGLYTDGLNMSNATISDNFGALNKAHTEIIL